MKDKKYITVPPLSDETREALADEIKKTAANIQKSLGIEVDGNDEELQELIKMVNEKPMRIERCSQEPKVERTDGRMLLAYGGSILDYQEIIEILLDNGYDVKLKLESIGELVIEFAMRV